MKLSAVILLTALSAPAADITLRWDAPGSNGVGTVLYSARVGGTVTNALMLGSETMVTLTNLPPVPHLFFLTAYDARGNQSQPSATLTATPGVAGILGAPTGLAEVPGKWLLQVNLTNTVTGTITIRAP